jgi:hypothetical protein
MGVVAGFSLRHITYGLLSSAYADFRPIYTLIIELTALKDQGKALM